MDYPVLRKERLLPCELSEPLLDCLKNGLATGGEPGWRANIGIYPVVCDQFGNFEQQVIEDWDDLKTKLSILPRIEFLQIIAEFPETGQAIITLQSFQPAGGELIVVGYDPDWVEALFNAVKLIFDAAINRLPARVYNRWGMVALHSVIPLMISSVIVLLAAGLLIPGFVRRSDWIWWITTGTVIVTLKLAQLISDRLLALAYKKYPYCVWSHR